MNIYIIITVILFFFILTNRLQYGKIDETLFFPNIGIREKTRLIGKNQLFSIILISLLLIIITGLRSSQLSWDYQNYEYLYKYVTSKTPWSQIIISKEPLFQFFMKVVGEISNYNTVILMMSMALLTVSILLWFIYKEAINPVFVVFLLFTIGSYITSFNTTRQYLAAAVYTLAFGFVYKRNIKGYMIMVFFASLIHSSAIAMVPFYWLLNLNWKRKNNILVNLSVIAVLIIFFLTMRKALNFLINIYYYNLGDNNHILYEAENSLVNIVRPLVIFLIAFLFRNLLNLNNIEDNCLFNSSLFFLVFYIYSYQITLFMRLTYFFIPASLILLDRLLNRMRKNNRQVIFGGLIIFCVVWCCFGMFRTKYLFYWQ